MHSEENNHLTIGQYLLNRLRAYGVQHIFGVPGDYVLRLNKLIEQHPEIEFINTIQENSAGYAADAYARFRGLGVACITYGVGISITNALAQAYVESSPLVVISGAPGIEEFKKNSHLHHLINTSTTINGDRSQLAIFKHVTIDQAILDFPHTAAASIDRVLNACMQYKKPVYLEIPRDQIEQPITTSFTPLFSTPHSNPETLREALDETQTILSAARDPIIWVGHAIARFGLSQAIIQFAEKHHIPMVASLLGKTVIDEHHPLYLGVYQGLMSPKEVSDEVHQSDCLLIAGVTLHELDTGIFTAKLDQKYRITADDHLVNIGCHQYSIHLSDYIKGLNTISLPQPKRPPRAPRHTRLPATFKAQSEAKTTTQRVFECLQSYLTSTSEYIVVSDVGDCLFGSADLVLHQNSFLSCSYFVSLGFGVPAAIGAQLANPNRRVIVVVGDGGFQMTAMELSMAIRYQLDPIIILLNNHGYGTERVLLEGSYNDIVNWNYTAIPNVLGGGIGIKAHTEDQFESALKKAFAHRGTFYLIEAELEKLDFSPALQRLGEHLGKIVKF